MVSRGSGIRPVWLVEGVELGLWIVEGVELGCPLEEVENIRVWLVECRNRGFYYLRIT